MACIGSLACFSLGVLLMTGSGTRAGGGLISTAAGAGSDDDRPGIPPDPGVSLVIRPNLSSEANNELTLTSAGLVSVSADTGATGAGGAGGREGEGDSPGTVL